MAEETAALRAERRGRVLAAMAMAGVDALVLGREANARYVSGARRLWTAGTRPFAPGCVVVGETGAVHLLSTWDDGIPDEIGHDELYGLSWNPMNLVGSLQQVPGLGRARRVGVDGMSPLFAQLLPMVVPDAELVDGQALLRAVRRVKTADEVACIRDAVAVAEGALAQVIDGLAPGVSERELVGRFSEAMASYRVTTPARGSFCVPELPLRRLPADRAIEAGELVAMDVAVLAAGYEGGLARTVRCGGGDVGGPAARWADLWDRLLAELRPRRTAGDVHAAYQASGEPPPPFPVVRGVGVGAERIDPSEAFEPGMVVSALACVWAGGEGYLGREMVLVTDGDPEVLTGLSHPG